MKSPFRLLLVGVALAVFTGPLTAAEPGKNPQLFVGWARCDLTPPRLPVRIDGLFSARLSEGVMDPLTATALVLDSGEDHVVFASLDLIAIPDKLRDAVRENLSRKVEGLDPQKVVIHATHTHSAPSVRTVVSDDPKASQRFAMREEDGFPAAAMSSAEYRDFVVNQLVDCIAKAWSERKPGSVAYGFDEAIVGRNRRWVDHEGVTTMSGPIKPEAKEKFLHVEGYEDHSLNVLSTYDANGSLTGLVVNLAAPSQQNESFLLSADFWHETRLELANRHGKDIFLLPQCGTAGDIVPQLIAYHKEALERMHTLRQTTLRREIGSRIADAVDRILPAIAPTANPSPVLRHEVDVLELPMAVITEEEAREATELSAKSLAKHRTELQKLQENPAARLEPRWYAPATRAFNRGHWLRDAVLRHEAQQRGEARLYPAEVHFIRLGDVAFATNPFEYYLDFGMQIKTRSPFIQTFLTQLAGDGTYVPSKRSLQGGGYGSTPASNPVGAEGGQLLADETVARLRKLHDSR
jgi:hypothetical protein